MSGSTGRSGRNRIWTAGAGIVAVAALATACATGARTAVRGSAPAPPALVVPAPAPSGPALAPAARVAPVTAPSDPVPAAGAAQDPQVAADIQAAEQSLSQVEADLSSVDQAATSGENDVPSN